MVREDELLADKYRVERVLGQGGMGYVVAAQHVQLQQRVAVKILMPDLCEDREAVERFLREARAAVRIQSEHVARVLDVGTLHDGTPFMVMEFLSGRDLARELDALGQIGLKDAVHYVLQACEAVAEAHALGVIHRDLKPANLFLTSRSDGSPLVKVLDFGVAKALSQDAVQLPSLTATQSVIGSPQYMSPEQVRSPKTVDFRTDVWSLGIILHELLTGAPPFDGDTPFSLLASIVSDPPRSVREKRPDVPEALEAVIIKCLEKTPDRRYQNVGELAQALAPHAPDSALGSVRRISRITPWSTPPAKGTTMPSAGSSPSSRPPPPSPNSATQPSNPVKDTRTDWGKSQTIAFRLRRNAALAIGSGVGLVAALVFWLGNRKMSDGTDNRSALAPVAVLSVPMIVNRSPPVLSDSPVASSLDAGPAADGSTLDRLASASGSAAASAGLRPLAQRTPPRPPTAPSKTPGARAPSPPETQAPDPLDGRR